ncbi:hypothetical protein M406DRAFT_266363, partial [Cryphonectria parasitica EP155]
EQQNQNLEQYFCAYCSLSQADWMQYLPLAQAAYNSADYSGIELLPAILLYEFQLTKLIDINMQRSSYIPKISKQLEDLAKACKKA